MEQVIQIKLLLNESVMFTKLEDIEFLGDNKELGEGAFSKVYKVKLKKTGEICALKKVA